MGRALCSYLVVYAIGDFCIGDSASDAAAIRRANKGGVFSIELGPLVGIIAWPGTVGCALNDGLRKCRAQKAHEAVVGANVVG